MKIDLSNPRALTPDRIAIWAAEDPDGTREVLQTPEFWRALLRSADVHVSDAAVDPGDAEAWLRAPARAEDLAPVATRGYFTMPGHVNEDRCRALADAILTLCTHGWDAPFIALVDEAWMLAAHIVDELQPLCSAGMRFRGELSAFCIDPGLAAGLPSGIGPHRDRVEPGDGHLTCWVALTDATVDNGCIRVVPDETEDEIPLCAAPGTLLGWNGQILHWGGVYNPHRATGPRVALAFAMTDYDAQSMWQEGMPNFAERLARAAEVMRELQPPAPGSAMDTILGLLERPAASPLPAAAPAVRAIGALPTHGELDRAIADGVALLRDELDHSADGLWHDFARQADGKGSTIWASAFIAAHIGRVDEGRDLAGSVAERLLALRRDSGGWGYDENLLEDCDSTAWVLLAAAAAGVSVPRDTLVPALRFILQHQDRSGGFVTYGPMGARIFGDIAARKGWFEAQPCVSAAAVMALATFAQRELPAIDNAVSYLLGVRQGDLWRPYWWFGTAYATHHALEALRRAGVDAPNTRRDALAATRAQVLPGGGFPGKGEARPNLFATALTVLTLASEDPTLLAQHADAIRLLLDAQTERGSLPGAAELRVPGGVTEETMTITDRGLFTTACIVHALDEVRRAR